LRLERPQAHVAPKIWIAHISRPGDLRLNHSRAPCNADGSALGLSATGAWGNAAADDDNQLDSASGYPPRRISLAS
jgi:hypothetical protein